MEEILHQLIDNFSHDLQGLYTSQVVVWDFFHQKYYTANLIRFFDQLTPQNKGWQILL